MNPLAGGQFGAILGDRGVDDQHREERDHRETEHIVPTERRAEGGREERREHGPGVAGTGQSKGGALMLWRIPARSERQRSRKGRAGDSE